jgi:hypothetical protein
MTIVLDVLRRTGCNQLAGPCVFDNEKTIFKRGRVSVFKCVHVCKG